MRIAVVGVSGCREIGLSLGWSLMSHSDLMDQCFEGEMRHECAPGRGLVKKDVEERMRLGGGSLRNSS